jgi:release factor glutamine methyltransferase
MSGPGADGPQPMSVQPMQRAAIPDDTVGGVLASARLPLAEGRSLLAHVLRLPRERLIAFPEAAVMPGDRAAFAGLAARRRAGEPMAYLLGEQEFYGLPFEVGPEVLIPRPATETLVDALLQHLQGRRAPRVLDLGTGSGCIAVAIARARPDAQVLAVDASAGALAIARRNAARHGAVMSFRQSDWYAQVVEAFDAVVANPPYVREDDPHLDGLRFEPRCALASGPDGLRDLRTIVDGAAAHLSPGGVLMVEHGYDQAADVRGRFRAAGFVGVVTRRDLQGHERVCIGRT